MIGQLVSGSGFSKAALFCKWGITAGRIKDLPKFPLALHNLIIFSKVLIVKNALKLTGFH